MTSRFVESLLGRSQLGQQPVQAIKTRFSGSISSGFGCGRSLSGSSGSGSSTGGMTGFKGSEGSTVGGRGNGPGSGDPGTGGSDACSSGACRNARLAAVAASALVDDRVEMSPVSMPLALCVRMEGKSLAYGAVP